MNRSNVPYIVAAALLVLAIGGWGIFLTGGNHEPADEPDAGTDAGTTDAGVSGADAATEEPEANLPDAGVDAGIALAEPPRWPDAGLQAGAVAAPSAAPDAGAAPQANAENAANAKTANAENDQQAEPKKGAISADAIRNVVAGMKPAIKACYNGLLDEFPDASGKVLVTFRVEAEGDEGRVTVIEVSEDSTLMDDKLLGCLTDAFGDAIFPVPEGGDTVQVTYPFQFATK